MRKSIYLLGISVFAASFMSVSCFAEDTAEADKNKSFYDTCVEKLQNTNHQVSSSLSGLIGTCKNQCRNHAQSNLQGTCIQECNGLFSVAFSSLPEVNDIIEHCKTSFPQN